MYIVYFAWVVLSCIVLSSQGHGRNFTETGIFTSRQIFSQCIAITFNGWQMTVPFLTHDMYVTWQCHVTYVICMLLGYFHFQKSVWHMVKAGLTELYSSLFELLLMFTEWLEVSWGLWGIPKRSRVCSSSSCPTCFLYLGDKESNPCKHTIGRRVPLEMPSIFGVVLFSLSQRFYVNIYFTFMCTYGWILLSLLSFFSLR